MKSVLLTCAAALMIPAGAFAQDPSLDLVGVLADYKVYVTENVDELVEGTTAFTEAVKAGDIDKAKALFGPTRMPYERVEPIASLFSDLDVAIDSRADDHEKAEADPSFTGFHRIEYALWEKNSTEGMDEIADKLLADVKDLQGRIEELTFSPDDVVSGASDLMDEVAATKISGEEDRYSHTDLFDFRANFDGSYKIFDLTKPLIAEKEADFVKTVEANFQTVSDTLDKYKDGDGYVSYNELTEDDKLVLSTSVNTLAEDLSTLRAKLGLD